MLKPGARTSLSAKLAASKLKSLVTLSLILTAHLFSRFALMDGQEIPARSQHKDFSLLGSVPLDD